MIGKIATSYCCEDLSLVENYQQAVDSKELWVIHHRFEEIGLLHSDLKEMKMYYHRPAMELIFLSDVEHKKFHNRLEHRKSALEKMAKSNSGKHHSLEWRNNISKSQEKAWNNEIRNRHAGIMKSVYSNPDVLEKNRSRRAEDSRLYKVYKESGGILMWNEWNKAGKPSER